MKRTVRRNALAAIAIVAMTWSIAGCEQPGEAPPSGGFENERVVTPAEVPPSAGDAADRPAPDSAAAPPDGSP